MRFSDLPFRSVFGSRNFALLWSGQTLPELCRYRKGGNVIAELRQRLAGPEQGKVAGTEHRPEREIGESHAQPHY